MRHSLLKTVLQVARRMHMIFQGLNFFESSLFIYKKEEFFSWIFHKFYMLLGFFRNFLNEKLERNVAKKYS